jgi:hypothetical protein
MQAEFLLALLMRLTMGVLAIQDPQTPVHPTDAARYAVSAYDASMRYGVDPFELIGTAANESDFVETAIGPDGLDCGITQTRVTGSRYSCWTLRHDVEIAFAEAGRELREDQDSCVGHADLSRCRLNRYNSGWFYAEDGFVGGYWLRTTCFETAARTESIPIGSCRWVRSYRDIRDITGSEPVAPIMLPRGVLATGPLLGPPVTLGSTTVGKPSD